MSRFGIGLMISGALSLVVAAILDHFGYSLPWWWYVIFGGVLACLLYPWIHGDL